MESTDHLVIYADAVILSELSVELGSDEHGFVIEGAVPSPASTPVLPNNTLVTWWPDSDLGLSGFVVRTGSQWGPFEVVLQVLAADPGPAGEQWQDVVELSVTVSSNVSVGEIVDGPVGGVEAPSGTYRMRVAASGRTESAERDRASSDDEQDEAPALEQYQIAIWQAEPVAPVIIRQDSKFANDEMDPPASDWPSKGDPRVQAAWAMIRDLRGETGSNALPGELGGLSVEVTVPGLPSRVFNRVQYVFGWPPCQGGTGGGPDPMATKYHDATLPEFDGHYEQAGDIATTPVELTKPKRVVFRWNWIPDTPGLLTSRPRLLAADSLVTITFQRLRSGDDPRTMVRLTHDGIPLVWVEHLKKLWEWHIVLTASR